MKQVLITLFILLFAISVFADAVEFSVDSIDFGEVTVGQTATLTVYVSSEIDQDITLTALNDPFSISPNSFHLSQGQSQEITITFSPTITYNYSVTSTATGSVYGSDTITINGEGISPQIDTDITSYNFGNVTIGSSDSVSVKIYNEGTGTLRCNLSFDNTHFSVSSDSINVNEADSTTFMVYFSPTVIPQENGTLTITSNDPVNSTISLTFTGSGRSDISGNVSGVWSVQNSPYYIVGNTTVPQGQTLTIEPGVEIVFNNSNYIFKIEGTLIAHGTAQDSISFKNGGEIYFYQPDNPADFKYCGFNTNIRIYFIDDMENGTDNWTFSGDGSMSQYSGGHNSSHCIRTYYGYSGTNNITSPVFTVQDENAYVSYWYKTDWYNSNDYYFKFQIKINNGNWIDIFTDEHEQYSWTNKSHNLSSYVTIGDQIQFRFENHFYHSGYMYIDDFIYSNEPTGYGKIHSYDSDITLENCNAFLFNVYTSTSSSSNSASISLTNCIFNYSNTNMIKTSSANSSISISNCVIKNASGTGVYTYGSNSPVTIINSHILNNSGSGVYTYGSNSSVTVTNSYILNNSGSGIYTRYTGSTVTLSTCYITNNASYGIRSKNNVTITNSYIKDNGDCGVSSNGNITVTSAEIENNNGYGISSNGNITITESYIKNNHNNGIYLNGNSSEISITSSIVVDNSGSGICCDYPVSINMLYSTITNNIGKGIYVVTNGGGNSFISITNSIIYGNDSSNHQQIYLNKYGSDTAILEATYSDIQGYDTYGHAGSGTFVWGDGCISSNPLFSDNDYHLSANSPCVDGATPWEHDANMPYGMGTVVADMGAYGGPNNDAWGGTPVPDGTPVIDNIFDIPQDQGGYVGIQFTGSIFDYAHSGYEITHYSFWRQMEERSKNSTIHKKSKFLKDTSPRRFTRDDEYWEYVGEMTAQGFENYGFTAPTMVDSNAYGNHESHFIVVAHTPDDDVYFVSSVGSGHSVDNLAPIQPQQISYDGENGVITLNWTPSPSEDLHFYKIYRGTESGVYNEEFTISDTAFVDNSVEIGTEYYYCLKAIDKNGNESEGEEVHLSLNYSNYNLHNGANLVSFRFINEDNSPAGMFSPLGMNILKVISEGEAATQTSENIWQGNLNEITYEKGYWLIMNDEAQLELMGRRASEEPTYYLHTNANLISYPQAFGNDISSAIPDSIEGHFIAIIGEGKAALHLENGNWIGSLTHFEKEKGYWVIVDSDITLHFEEATPDKNHQKDDYEIPEFFAYNQSALQAFYISGEISINGHELEESDWIAAFKDNVCIGATHYMGINTTIPAMGNDGNDYSINYANENDEITFKVWDSSENLIYTCDNSEIWHNGSINQIEINSFLSADQNGIIPTVNSLSQNYPNPFNPTTTIRFGLKKDSKVKIDLYNIKGQKITTIYYGYKKAGYHSIKITLDNYSSGVYLYKMTTDDFSKIKRMVLLK